MNALIIGFGAAGKRHANILALLGYKVCVVSKHASDNISFQRFLNISDAFCNRSYEICVIASVTSEHILNIEEIQHLSKSTIILVEKPISSSLVSLENFNKANEIYVGYNMRFLVHMELLKKRLMNEKVIRCNFVVSSYMPNWRPERHYSQGYSTSRLLGGGVLRELSHELDLIIYLLGTPIRSFSNYYNSGMLGGDSEDGCDVIFCTERCQSGLLSLNFHSKNIIRYLQVDTLKHSFYYDFIKSEFWIDGKDMFPCLGMNQSYHNMHRSIMQKEFENVASFNDGIKVMEFINQIEISKVSFI